MHFDVLTLFPEMISGALGHSVIGRGQDQGHFSVGVHDMRAHGLGKHRSVDDAPYGGGSGMVLRVDVVAAALEAVRRPESHVVLMDPAGTPFRQADARRLAELPHVVLLCGHYEGVDGRVRDHLIDEAMSIGDYVLTGGELAAMVIVDAVGRLQPGVLGNADSLTVESFGDGLLEAPCYTRPQEWQGHAVPDVLRSGHHGRIEEWKREQSLERTRNVRPDLLSTPPGG